MQRSSWLVLALVVGSCERASDGTKRMDLPAPKVTVTLEDAGAEPRTALRLHYKPVTARYESTIDITDHYKQRTERRPLRVTSAEARVIETKPDGSFHQTTKYVEVADRARPGDVAAKSGAEKGLALQGVEIDAWYDARGNRTRATAIAPADADIGADDLESGGTQAIVLPEQPIGAGARWRVETDAGSRTSVTELTLAQLDGDQAELRTTFDATYRSQRTVIIHGTRDVHLDLGGPMSTMRGQIHSTFEGAADYSRDMISDTTPK